MQRAFFNLLFVSLVVSLQACVAVNSAVVADTPGLKTLAAFPIGVAVNVASAGAGIQVSKERADLIGRHFNSLVAENSMKMSYLHPAENNFTFAGADALASYAHQHGMVLHGHALVWHSDYQIPVWMKNYQGDWEKMLASHVSQICAHFAGTVRSWDVVNEAIDDLHPAGYRASIFYEKIGKSYIEKAFIAAHAADANAELYYNDYNIEGSQGKLDFMLRMIDDFKSRQIPLHGIGFQMHVSSDGPGIAQIRKSFKAVADRGLKVRISELDVAMNQQRQFSTFTPAVAAQQKARYKAIITAYLEAVPPAQRGGITFWGLLDGDSWIGKRYQRPDWPLLFADDYSAKPALSGVAEALTGK
ncbi:endo-1,4-beta-xylanase [Undibacterium sp. TJN19]|uniref:endo-1,4-beta-xylanase n=1 Tax=Undibacterium sp. TJN19 TaxID=3413055 RepID=UPI003BF41880